MVDDIKLYSFNIFNTLIRTENTFMERVFLLFKFETNYNIKNIYPIKENIEKLKQFLIEGKRVVLIEYTALSSEFLRKYLVELDEVFKDIRIYVSSAYKINNKGIYRIVSIAENVDYKNWQHFGNNKHINLACKLGINVCMYKIME